MTAKTPSGPRKLPIIGNTHQWVKGPCEFKERAAEYGRVVNYKVIGMDSYMLTEPEDIERVLMNTGDEFHKHEQIKEQLRDAIGTGLFTSEGELWERQREAMKPAFYLEHTKNYAQSMVGRASDAADCWHDGETIGLRREMQQVTLEILLEAMLGADIDIADRGMYDAVDDLLAVLEPSKQPITMLAPDWAPIPFLRRRKEAIEHLESQVYDILESRRTSDEDRSDLMSMLLASDEEMDDEQIRDEMMTFLLAGHETSALTLTYSLHLLSQNPDVARRLREELDEVIDGKPEFEDALSLSYTESVVKEAMRLYPPAHELRRAPKTDVTFGDYLVPEGSLVILPTWVLHRDERFWDDPETFRPERWEEQGDRPEFAYFPFGGGPRRCIGQQLATLEAKLVLATLLKDWEFEREYDEIELSAGQTLQPKGDVEMTVHRR
ncbi:cytochrome P450 [Halorussus caseinilyticus]|uniref:Cytochrome P450 n=1 Tax=Halorussus caseinilyticus TaxID=3034025 RepID=A0ABD5WUT6_9EURY|nr:cytochrome P450 [Halorussus sp. DT72]